MGTLYLMRMNGSMWLICRPYSSLFAQLNKVNCLYHSAINQASYKKVQRRIPLHPFGAPRGTRTPNTSLRRRMLYPIELAEQEKHIQLFVRTAILFLRFRKGCPKVLLTVRGTVLRRAPFQEWTLFLREPAIVRARGRMRS